MLFFVDVFGHHFNGSGSVPTFFIFCKASPEKMTHPLIPQIIDLANPVAESIGLEVVGAVLHTNQHPPILRVDIRNLQQDTGLDDCERMSRALELALDGSGLLADAYILEVSSPGIDRQLTTDREFISFKGFPVTVMTTEPFQGQKTWSGQLVRQDEEAIHLSRKGRAIAIPKTLVSKVQLSDRNRQ
jgi:ribosome maturation factor RimP